MKAVVPMVSDSTRFLSSKGEISMLTPCFATGDSFEIYCIEGDLFDDIERFESESEAMSAIKKYLGLPQSAKF